MDQMIVVSVFGLDCPGVVYAVSKTLAGMDCNIEEVSQTILKNQFGAIFIVSIPNGLDIEKVQQALVLELEQRSMQLSVSIRPFEVGCAEAPEPCEPFVITVYGQDRKNIVANISGMFAIHKINIENLRSLSPEKSPSNCVMMFEVALPLSLDWAAFRRTLQDKAKELSLSLSIQHRDIFQAVNRIPIT